MKLNNDKYEHRVEPLTAILEDYLERYFGDKWWVEMIDLADRKVLFRKHKEVS